MSFLESKLPQYPGPKRIDDLKQKLLFPQKKGKASVEANSLQMITAPKVCSI